jgi:hypothetical protein
VSQSELLKKVVDVLDRSQTPYMLTGSYASSLQGEPRLTHDIDLVVLISASGSKALLDTFTAPDYYLDAQSIQDAIERVGQFNLLDVTGGDKVDFWILTDDPFDQSRFHRRTIEEFAGQKLHVSRPEDTILMKLRWSALSGGSEKQFGDARGVYELQSGTLDLDYMNHWAKTLGVMDDWQRLQRESSSNP